jgi:predicted MFS family arabinose efflux permease
MGLAFYPQLTRLGPANRTAVPARSDTRRAIDAVALATGSTLLLAALSVGSVLPALGLLGIGGWLALGALRHLLPPGSLRLARGRPSVVVTVFAVGFAFFGTEAFVPLTVVEVRGGTVTLGGIALSAAAVSWAAGSWLQARAAGIGMRRTLVSVGAALITAGIAITAAVLLPDAPVLVAAVGWAVAGLGMGLAYSMLALLMLETATPGEEGFSSSALQLMFTLGTAFGAGIGGAVVALAETGALDLIPALGIVNAIMFVVAIFAVLISLRVPREPAEPQPGRIGVPAGIPLEHP